MSPKAPLPARPNDRASEEVGESVEGEKTGNRPSIAEVFMKLPQHPLWSDGTWSRFVEYFNATEQEQTACWEYLALIRMRKMLSERPKFQPEYEI